MIFPRRIVRAVATVIVLACAFGGCAPSGDEKFDLRIEGLTQAQQRDFMKSLVQLRRIPGVREVSWTATPKPYWDSVATIEVGVSDAFAEQQLGVVASTLNQHDGNGKGPGLPISFSIRLPGDDASGFTVSGLGLPRDEVVENYRYWREITAVMEFDVKLTLHATVFIRDEYMRVISAPADTQPSKPLRHMIDNYDALAALTPPESTPADALSATGRPAIEFWSFPGLQSFGSLPPREVLDVAERLSVSFSFPLRPNAWLTSEPEDGDSFPEGVGILWDDESTAQHGRQVELLFPEYREEEWPAIVAAAAASSQLAGFHFRYFSFDRSFSFHTSACEGTIQSTADDHALIAAIQASGVTLLDGAAAGQCIPDFDDRY